MKRLKRFFTRIGESIYSKEFYKKLQTTPFRYSLKYYLGFVLCLSVVSAIGFATVVSPLIQKGFKNAVIQNDLPMYPDGLVVTIKGGTATSNQLTPVLVPYTPSNDTDRQNYSDIKNILVVDTASSASLEKFREYHTMVLLANDALVVYSGTRSAEIRVYPLSTFPDTVISKEKIKEVILMIGNYLWVLWPLLLVAGFFVGIIVGFSKLVTFFLYALLVWGLLSIMKVKANYKKSYQYVLHAATLPTLLSLVTMLIPGHFSSRGVAIILILVVVYINMHTATPIENTTTKEPENNTAI